MFTGFDPHAFPLIRLIRGKVAVYNMHLRVIADRRDCRLVDLWSMRVLGDPREWSADRLHLGPDGHRRVALRTCEVMGLTTDADWREPLPPRLGPEAVRLQAIAWPRRAGLTRAGPGRCGALGRQAAARRLHRGQPGTQAVQHAAAIAWRTRGVTEGTSRWAYMPTQGGRLTPSAAGALYDIARVLVLRYADLDPESLAPARSAGSGVQEGQDGQHPAVVVGRRGQVQLGEDARGGACPPLSPK